jgi:hypothetical protein
MAPQACPSSIPRHLVVQCWLGLAIGLLFAILMYATDLGGIGSLLAMVEPTATLIFLVGSAVVFVPFVVATAIGLLALED